MKHVDILSFDYYCIANYLNFFLLYFFSEFVHMDELKGLMSERMLMMKKKSRTFMKGFILTVITGVCFLVFDSMVMNVSADRQLIGEKNLSVGMDNDQVNKLQLLLSHAGFLESISNKGEFTKEVQQAVIAFQQTNHIQQDGIAGPQTLGALQVLEWGDNGRLVTYLQRKLEKLGYYNGPVDGQFDQLTNKAVKHFQADHGLQVDGLAGPKTYGALHKTLTKRLVPSRSNHQKESPQSSQSTTIQMEATAYTAYCDGCSGITYTGLDLRANPDKKVVAVDPQVIPLGSMVYVEGYGEAVAADIGGAIKGNRIDIFMPNRDDALKFGRQTVDVTIKN
ncbi:peptidoglycan-binding protein [Salipaludibacillus sp. LMS25]|uniref:peptidoglycan-binding protein n=1 Tax=Salipaludibacillus sp. LMS25 TaxID=2924031 RepID=UPI0020D13ACB|nr:peptidoglycan-binding protein [Salipaludibacillus sp. LMS25]UTR14760.1 peptidoglycan-binding protein [Salipaludibacillus sp. LMS25]